MPIGELLPFRLARRGSAMPRLLLFILLWAPFAGAHAQFDHEHKAWGTLLKKHVVLIDGGKASQVRYAEMQKDHARLRAYLESLSRVGEREFQGWTKAQQLAFLINAYNAFMIEKILARYPDIRSVWDFGKIFGNPFRDRFFALFGREFSLDMIEHDTIRAKGVYDEPRIHFAINCAAISCPMLREEAYVAERLEQQLEQQTQRFLSDRSRNRYNPETRSLEVSKIFDTAPWYSVDFTSGLKGIKSREQFFAKYANLLADNPEHQKIIREQRAEIRHLDYDWGLNDAKTVGR